MQRVEEGKRKKSKMIPIAKGVAIGTAIAVGILAGKNCDFQAKKLEAMRQIEQQFQRPR